MLLGVLLLNYLHHVAFTQWNFLIFGEKLEIASLCLKYFLLKFYNILGNHKSISMYTHLFAFFFLLHLVNNIFPFHRCYTATDKYIITFWEDLQHKRKCEKRGSCVWRTKYGYIKNSIINIHWRRMLTKNYVV